MQLALKRVRAWAFVGGLGVNIIKIKVVLFTKRYKPPFFRSLKFQAETLEFKSKTHFMGLDF